MNLNDKNILELSKKIAEGNGFFLIDFVVRGNTNNKVFEIFIDGKKNVSSEDCAKINREINRQIEDNSLISSSYRLDVSSPGVDRPLIYLNQFPKHINRRFEVFYTENEIQKKIVGTLRKVEGDSLAFEVNKNELEINFNKIKKAKVIISFS